MNTFHDTRIARTARFLAARLESEPEIRLTIRSWYADSRLFRIMAYMGHYCGKYWLEYSDNDIAIIRKQG